MKFKFIFLIISILFYINNIKCNDIIPNSTTTTTIPTTNNNNLNEPKSIQTIIDYYFDNFLVSALGKKFFSKKRFIIFNQSRIDSKTLPSSASSLGQEQSIGYQCQHDEIKHRFIKPTKRLNNQHHYRKITIPLQNSDKELLINKYIIKQEDDPQQFDSSLSKESTKTKNNNNVEKLQKPPPLQSFNKPTSQSQQQQFNILNNKNLLNSILEKNSIRFYINNTYITSKNDRFACHSIGERIVMGFSGVAKEDCRADLFNGAILNSPCFYSCQEKDVQSLDLQILLQEYVVKATFDIFSNIISVRNPDSTLKLVADIDEPRPVQCTRGVVIPEHLYNVGINNTDHYVFITSRPTPDLMTIAYSLICDSPIVYYGDGHEQWIYDRPRVSVLNFNPLYFTRILESQSKWTFNQFMRVGIHEMVHSLGFSSSLYSSFINPETGIPYAFNLPITKTVTENGVSPLGKPFSREKYLITSPSVVNYTKTYFGCPSAEGFELEDYGGAGTAGSHWEKRAAEEEIMTGYISPTLPLSRLTLSFLYDTGWYIPNFNFSESHRWGRGLGCDWLKNCENGSWNHQGYFCENFREMGCTANRLGKGICQIVRYQDTIPIKYQHFNSTSIGGSNRASDYCPYFQIVHSLNCPSCSYCSNSEETPNKQIKEEFGKNSKCFNYNIIYLNYEQATTSTTTSSSTTTISTTTKTTTVTTNTNTPIFTNLVSTSAQSSTSQLSSPLSLKQQTPSISLTPTVTVTVTPTPTPTTTPTQSIEESQSQSLNNPSTGGEAPIFQAPIKRPPRHIMKHKTVTSTTNNNAVDKYGVDYSDIDDDVDFDDDYYDYDDINEINFNNVVKSIKVVKQQQQNILPSTSSTTTTTTTTTTNTKSNIPTTTQPPQTTQPATTQPIQPSSNHLNGGINKKANYEKKVGCWINRCSEKKIVQIKIDDNWIDCNYNSTIQVAIDANQYGIIVLELICPIDYDLCL